MKKSTFLFFIILVSAISFSSCKKKIKGCTDPISANYNPDAEESDGSCTYAGIGGNTTIVAFPKHHGVSIISGDSAGYMDTAYVKFNATNSPGLLPGNYDLVLPGDSGEDHVHLEGLKPGKYFIFMTGFDKSINKRVFGGVPYVLTQTSGEVDLNVAVSEE